MATLPHQPATLNDLQAYTKTALNERGFSAEPVAEKFMLLVEEVGELAKAARKSTNIKIDPASQSLELAHEFADIFILLMDLANKLNIDLETAFRDKENINQQRTWK